MKLSLPSLPLAIGRVTIHPGRGRSKGQHMGRFGGGWQYKLGITAGERRRDGAQTILVALWTDEYRVEVAPRAGRA